jgi:outer membrane protein TolC
LRLRDAAPLLLAILSTLGCASPELVSRAHSSTNFNYVDSSSPPNRETSVPSTHTEVSKSKDGRSQNAPVVKAAYHFQAEDDAEKTADGARAVPLIESDLPSPRSDTTEDAEAIAAGRRGDVVQLNDVIDSVYRSFPLLEAAYYERDMAFGEHLAAHGAFDLKVKGASENGPQGFYETYRQNIGVEQPTYGGGALFGGYRIGRGSFQPWYLERQTNDGGEFRAGLMLPLLRNVVIDARRAQLWRTDLGRQLADPEIQAQRIDFVRAGSYAYWDWVAAGHRHRIAAELLQIAVDRNEAIRRKVETGDTEPPVLQDNRRLIVSREAKLIETERKLRQAAVKLSLFYRNQRGEPLLVDVAQMPGFPDSQAVEEDALAADIETALANRPELQALNLLRQQFEIDFAEARNDLLPDLQAAVWGSQDVGTPATAKNDKSEFELDAGLFLDVPVQRRKARGKMTAVEGKLGQLAAKRRMTGDKIATDVQAVYAALLAAYQQIQRARESAELAERLAEIERRKFELGESDLLSVNLREQQAAEAQNTEVDALYEYFTARADYRAVLAED